VHRLDTRIVLGDPLVAFETKILVDPEGNAGRA
jgi:hypothetical protein